MDILSIYNLKLKNLLAKLLDPQFQIKNDSNMNLLLSHLSGKDNTELGKTLLNLPIFMEWLENAINYWEMTNQNVSQDVASFTINLTALLVTAENRFYLLYPKNSIMRLCTVLKLRTTFVVPSIKLAYIKLLTALTSHKPGLDWLIATQFWKDGINFCFSSETMYVQRETYNFVYNLLVKCTEFSEQFTHVVVEQIVPQLNDARFDPREVNRSVEHKRQLMSLLKLISYILETFFHGELFKARKFKLPNIFIKDFHIKQTILNFLAIPYDMDLLYELSKAAFIVEHLITAINSQNDIISITDLKKLYMKILKIITLHIGYAYLESVLKLSQDGQALLSVLNERLPSLEEMETQQVSLANLYLLIQTVPVFLVSINCCKKSVLEIEEDESKEQFFFSALAAMCNDTFRIIYKLRDTLLKDEGNEEMVFYIAHKSLMSIDRCFKHFRKQETTKYFQILSFLFKDIVTSLKEKPCLLSKYLVQEKFICFLMQTISKFVTEFDITWKDAYETVYLVDVCLDYLNIMDWPPKVIVESLKMLNILISKHMTPSMILLSDSAGESSVSQVPSILFARLHDPNWEVRDSALEVLHTLAIIAQAKFPSFQSIIIDSGLPQLLVTVSTEDGESFVRASALKCLQELIKIQRFWSEIFIKENISGKVMLILETETEAIVRCEAATLICEIYKHQIIENSILQQVHATMYHAATSDLHWEVKVKALEFWNIVINKQLVNQGMIDGTFPSVTFSKENRKIVNLTEKEVQIRLNKVLHKLSECGCLTVLLSAMQDEYDLAVSKKAVEITKSLVNILSNYNIVALKNMCDMPLSPSPKADCFSNNFVPNLSSPTCSSNLIEADNVIDQIVNTKDLNLLEGVCVGDTGARSMSPMEKQIKVVTPCDFLDYIQRDLDLLILEKQKWLNKFDDLGSLLDDMLKNYGDFDDVNVMDCY